MDNRIIAIENYWAAVVRDTGEFQQIAAAVNPEFNRLSECIKRIMQEAFINDASEYGVSRWESILKLSPNADDTLEDRKIKILTYLNIRLPYTMRVLKEMITAFVGENNFTLKFINDNRKLIVRIKVNNQSQYDTILNLLNNVIPMDVVIDLGYLE